MNQFMIRAYTSPHGGRTGVFYERAVSEQVAAASFRARNPAAVIRDMWRLIPPTYYTNTNENQSEEIT